MGGSYADVPNKSDPPSHLHTNKSLYIHVQLLVENTNNRRRKSQNRRKVQAWMEEMQRSLEQTPIWAVSFVCLVLILLSILIEAALNLLTNFFKTRKRKSLNRALGKIKTELMILGFISLLLTISEVPISKICVTKAIGNSFLPCKPPHDSKEPEVFTATQITNLNTSLPTEIINESSCESKGMISLLSREGVEQLHIFIFVLAVFHVLYCVLTMCLGAAKMRKWKTWEEETRTLEYQIANDPRRFRLTRQTSFGRRHLKCWSDQPFLIWPVCFLGQFSGSVTKSDYFTLRNGFIVAHFTEGSNFDFQKFLARVYDRDFEQVVGISFWIWILSIVLMVFSAHGFYNYFWLPFIPLLLVLIVSTKLEVIITKMCLKSRKETVVRGALLVKPNDDLFWFGRPQWILHIIHFILFQNSFQLAFFTWTWYEYGLRSCFHRETVDIALRITMGVITQFLCGYVTLPLYVLVRQMGTSMKATIFTDRVVKGLKQWRKLARQNLSQSKSNSTRHSTDATETSLSDIELGLQEYDHDPPLSLIISPTPENTDEATQHKIITEGTYDGEISFGTSWKELGSRKEIENITSSLDETASDI